MKKTLKNLLTSASIAVMSYPTVAFAGTTTNNGNGNNNNNDPCSILGNCSTGNPGDGMDNAFSKIRGILTQVLGFARWVGVAVCVIMLVWCAIKLATSSGNVQKRQLAMDGIKNVLIAVAIIGSATLIASVAYGILNTGNTGNTTTP